MLLEAWESTVLSPAWATILPDGCQDLLFTALPGQAPRWEVTTLDDTAYKINMPAGTYFKGYRMQAGVGFCADNLLQSLHNIPPDHAGIEDRLHAFTHLDPLVKDALAALQEQARFGGRVAHAACRLGVHPRRLQRVLARHTGRSGAAWLALGRVRTAARAVAAGGALADVAYDTGFADQPHMHRAFRHWLGCTPRNAPVLLPGYG